MQWQARLEDEDENEMRDSGDWDQLSVVVVLVADGTNGKLQLLARLEEEKTADWRDKCFMCRKNDDSDSRVLLPLISWGSLTNYH